MAPQQKGKQGTKGAKQIVEENVSTLNFYRNMALVANGIAFIELCLYNSTANIIMFIFAVAIYVISYQFMAYMARSKHSETGQLIDSGIDLNMAGGIAEHAKDLIILTTGCQVLSVLSNYLWFLWLSAPLRGFWMLWKNVLHPWITREPDTPEINEKKQKKMERKMKRMKH